METVIFYIVVTVIVLLGLIWAHYMKKQEEIEKLKEYEMNEIRLTREPKL
jgi:hypothetical protein